MFKNYLKTAFRNFLRYKGNTLINIIGLAIGVSVFFLIIQYVTFELSYDQFHKNADRIYRVRNDRIYSDKHDKSAGCPPALAPTLKQEFPEVRESARLYTTRYMNNTVSYKSISDKIITYNEEKIYYTDGSFLKIFSFPMLEGSVESVLEAPYTAIISETTAKKYFGNENPLDKSITLTNDYGYQTCKITGIFKDVPENSHVKFDILFSYQTLINRDPKASYYWGWNAFNTFVLLAPNADPKALESKFPEMIEKYKDYDKDYKRVYSLQPLKDIHLHSNLRFEPEVNGDIKAVNFLSIIAVFVLILAWVNYINLATSRSLTRAKEVGIRKVLGSNRLQLIKQFLTESFLLNIIALILALIIDEMVLPYFNRMTGKPLTIDLLKSNWNLLTVMFTAGVFLSGIYPAFVMASFNPIFIFKTKLGRMSHGIDLRKILVIFQFAVSIILITSTIIVYEQLAYMNNQNIGLNIEQIITLKAPMGGRNSFPVTTNFKDVLLTLPGIKNVAISASIPGKGYSNAASGVRKYGSNPEDGTQGFFIDIDENYFNLFEIPLLAGRCFNRESRFNGEIIINEEAVKVYDFKNPEDAVAKKLIFDGFGGQSIEIVGVIKNHHHESLKSSLQPVVFNPVKADDINRSRYISVKIDGRNIQQTIEQIKHTWDEIFPNQPFEYFFLDEAFNSQYKADQQFGKVFGLFTSVAIIISCLGLLGLAAYINLQRTKEIGIRKVVGASLQNILVMLVKDFTKWVLLANLIAWPVAYYTMNKWLQNFAYRIDINFWIFLLAGGLALVIALLTVSWQAIRATIANPVESLRYE